MTKLQQKKAKEVILYLLQKCGKMSRKKMTYLLYFLCFDYYEKFNKDFLGFNFYKTKKGIKIKEL